MNISLEQRREPETLSKAGLEERQERKNKRWGLRSERRMRAILETARTVITKPFRGWLRLEARRTIPGGSCIKSRFELIARTSNLGVRSSTSKSLKVSVLDDDHVSNTKKEVKACLPELTMWLAKNPHVAKNETEDSETTKKPTSKTNPAEGGRGRPRKVI